MQDEIQREVEGRDSQKRAGGLSLNERQATLQGVAQVGREDFAGEGAHQIASGGDGNEAPFYFQAGIPEGLSGFPGD
jgi:hypothetical protein